MTSSIYDAFLAPKTSQNGTPKPPKNDQKTTQKRTKKKERKKERKKTRKGAPRRPASNRQPDLAVNGKRCFAFALLSICFLLFCAVLAALVRFWVLCGCSWELFGRSWALLGRSWALLERSWGALGRSWALLGRSWDTLGRSWSARRTLY